jgi:rare lipoprotein A (peptidoglycan hydrolase)
MKKLVMGCAVAAMVALSARSEARPSESMAYAKYNAPKPKSVDRAVGVASWYGEAFQGNPTASGEPYDMNELTAANRSLPLGTQIKVTNLRNHRTLLLRVNDRGPYIPGRFLDVSKRAARQLGFEYAGLAKVQIEVVRYPEHYRQRLAALESPVSEPDQK